MKLIDILHTICFVFKLLLVLACVIIVLSEPVGYNTGENYGSGMYWMVKFAAIGYLFYLFWK